MSYNGSGTFVINSSGQPVVTGTTISSTAFNALTADLATGLSTALTKDGQTTPTTDIPMGSHKVTGLLAGTATTDAANVVQVQAGQLNWAAAGGTADAITATYSPVIAALTDGLLCYVRAGSSNTTTTPTFSASGLTARTITRLGGGPVVATEWSANQELQLRYNLANTRWELLNWRRIVNTDVAGLGTMSTQAASAVNITGGTLSGITSFASNNVAITGGSVTGITDIVVADGGTGASTFTDGGVIIGNGTGALQVTTAGTSGHVLTSNGAGVDPTFQAIPTVSGTLTAGTACTKNPYATSTQTTQAHGLGVVPAIIDVYLECLSAEANYSVGDRVNTTGLNINADSGWVVEKDTTNLILITAANPPYVLNKTTSAVTAITAANWKVVATPYKLN